MASLTCATCGGLHRLTEQRPGVGAVAAAQQIVSMARALPHNVRFIIMDEPSSVLDGGEVERLFHVIGDETAEEVGRD